MQKTMGLAVEILKRRYEASILVFFYVFSNNKSFTDGTFELPRILKS